MQICRDTDTIYEALRSSQDAELHQLISAHIERLQEFGDTDLGELVHFVVFEQGDRITDLDAALGFPIMTNRFDNTRFGQAGFMPSWETVEEHMLWFECVYVLSDDGAGVVVFVPTNTDSELLPMLQRYARQ